MLENTLVLQELAFSMNELLKADGFNFDTPEVRRFVSIADDIGNTPYYFQMMADLLNPPDAWDVPQTVAIDITYDVFTQCLGTEYEDDGNGRVFPILTELDEKFAKANFRRVDAGNERLHQPDFPF